jgi:hypothetical protein
MALRALRLGLTLSMTTAFFSMAACGSSKDATPPTGSTGGVVLAERVAILEAKTT